MTAQGIILTIICGGLFIIACKAYLERQKHKFQPKPYKVGLDIHGVLDTAPEFFSHISQLLVIAGCEVHVITGAECTPELIQQLKDLGISYTHFFSIVDHEKSIGTPITYLSPGNPKIDDEIWNKAKAQYCSVNQIDMMLDDSPIYGDHFTTPYIQLIVKKFAIEK